MSWPRTLHQLNEDDEFVYRDLLGPQKQTTSTQLSRPQKVRSTINRFLSRQSKEPYEYAKFKRPLKSASTDKLQRQEDLKQASLDLSLITAELKQSVAFLQEQNERRDVIDSRIHHVQAEVSALSMNMTRLQSTIISEIHGPRVSDQQIERSLKTEVSGLSENISSLRSEMLSEFQKLKVSDLPVSRLSHRIDSSIKEISKEIHGHPFLQTEAFNAVTSLLEENNIAFLTGLPGDGKTFIAYQCAMQYKKTWKMKPFIVQFYRDWQICILPESKLFLIVEDFCEKDAFSESFYRNVEYHLQGIHYNVNNQPSSTSNKVIVVLRKEILQLVRPSLEKLCGFSKTLIVDLSSYGHSLSDKEKEELWQMYDGVNKNVALYKTFFGYPKICQFFKDDFFEEKIKEFYLEIIRQIEPEFFLTMAEICLNNTEVCIKALDRKERVQTLIDSFILRPVHLPRRNVFHKLSIASMPLTDVYLERRNENYDSFLAFIQSYLSYYVAVVILERNSEAVLWLCALKQLHFFKKILINENIGVPQRTILEWMVKRITYELRTNTTLDIILDIVNLEEWVNDDFIEACLEDENLSQAFLNIEPFLQEYCIECAAKTGKINLMKVLYSFLKMKRFLTICSKKDIILTVSDSGSIDMFKLLIDLGLKLHQDNAIRIALFLKVVEKNHLPLLRFIVQTLSLDKRVLPENSFSAFHYAAKSRSLDMLTFLVEKGCNANTTSDKNETILHITAKYGNVSMLNWLYNKYPHQWKIKTKSGYSILHYSACNEDTEVLTFLLKEVGMDPYEKTKNDESLLHIAIKSGNNVVIKHLIDHYLDMVAMQDINGFLALHVAALEGNLEIVKLLCLQKHNLRVLPIKGENILHCAAKCKNLETFEYLMKKFCYLEGEKTKKGLTLLHTASEKGSLDIVKYLICQGFNARERTAEEKTAIHYACQSGNFEVVKFLSQKYPDQLYALDIDGFDPMLTAAKSKSLKTVQYLMMTENWRGQTSKEGQDILHVACSYSNVDIVRYLCKYKTSSDRRDYSGKTVLHHGAMNPSIDVLKYLLKIGINRYALSASKQSALHFACFNKNAEVFKYLWTELPYIRFQSDASGYSILHYSCEAGNKEALEFCLKEGFNIRSKTKNNNTPLEIALLHGQYSLANIIKEKYVAQNWHRTAKNVFSQDMAKFHECCLKQMHMYELAIIPQRIMGKPESKLLAMCLIDPCIRKDNEDQCSNLRKKEGIFERLHHYTKHKAETNTFQEVMLRSGILESSEWHIRIAFLFPEEISDHYLKMILQEIQTYEMQTYKEKNTIKAVTKGICKLFWIKYRDILDICSVWAGLDCSVKKENLVCFDTIVVITNCKRNSYKINIDNFYGLRIYYRDFKTFSLEAKQMMKYETNKFPPIHLKKRDMKNVLSKHSNITLISVSSVKSIGFTENEHVNPVEQQTVVIYCRVKGIIPVGEEMFPTQIGSYPVDIRESEVMLATGREGLLMGDKIGPEDLNAFGTLGGFVDIDSKRKGFITCAHIMRRLGTDNQRNAEYMNSQNVCLIDDRGIHPIGHVVRETFTLDDNSDVDVSTDAVLIEIDNRFPETGHFTANLNIHNIQQEDFRKHGDLMFTRGETATVEECTSKMVMKVGASTGLTRGHIHFDKAEAIIDRHSVLLQDCRYVLHGQIEVKPHRCNNFITEGDSGSFVFLIEKVKPPLLKCIGIVVARTDHGTCLMTPIENVMDSLGLKTDQLSKFQNEQEEDILIKMLNDLKNEMKSQHSETNSNISGVRESINQLETRLDTVEERVFNTENDNTGRCNMS